MSSERAIWNDGQGLSTPDLQRPANDAAFADDRVYENILTPGFIQKRLYPLFEEQSSTNPRFVGIPSGVTAGSLQVLPCSLVAQSSLITPQSPVVSLQGTLYTALSSAVTTSNASGSTRYDLIYLTLSRAVTTTGTRKIKSATDGSLSSQSINLAEGSSITVGTNAGFLTGATAPTLAQILSATPADTNPSSSTYGVFNFPIAVVTVANGYTSGTNLTQSQTTQCWQGGFVPTHRVRGTRPMSIFYNSANERAPAPSITLGTQFAERGGSDQRFVAWFKILSTTPIISAGGTVIDTTIDWRNRLVWGWTSYLGSANTSWPLETNNIAAGIAAQGFAGKTGGSNAVPINLFDNIAFGPAFTGGGSNTGNLVASMGYGAAAGATVSVLLGVNASGNLIAARSGTVVDSTNGDFIALVIHATDRILT